MPTIVATAPNGKEYEIEMPEGYKPADVDTAMDYIVAQESKGKKPARPAEGLPLMERLKEANQTISDYVASGASGMAEGMIGGATLPMEIGNLMTWAAKQGGADVKTWGDVYGRAPTESVIEAMFKPLGGRYTPETPHGRRLKTTGEWVGATMAPALGSEALINKAAGKGIPYVSKLAEVLQMTGKTPIGRMGTLAKICSRLGLKNKAKERLARIRSH